MNPPGVPTEHDEQSCVLAWAQAMRGTYPELALLFAVPNGARTSISVAKRLKAEGLQAGVPDLCLPVARKGWHGLWIEVKRQKGGRLTQEQRWWGEQLRAHGQFAVMAAGAERAIHWIERYLGGGTVPDPVGVADERAGDDAGVGSFESPRGGAAGVGGARGLRERRGGMLPQPDHAGAEDGAAPSDRDPPSDAA